MKLAVIGAGMSGVIAANAVKNEYGGSIDVTVFEKSRGAGGRMSTRRTEEFEFDHGAQYFTAKHPQFDKMIAAAVDAGQVAPWTGKALYLKDGKTEADTGGARFAAVPRMNSWIKSMAQGLTVQTSQRVSALSREDGRWTLKFESGETAGGFDYVVSSIPAPQAHALLSPIGFTGAALLQESVKMQACFAVMAGFSSQMTLPWVSLRSPDGPASWIALNSAKPGRKQGQSAVIIHAGPNWSDAHTEAPKDEVQSLMLSEASRLSEIDFARADYLTIHRWLYASVLSGAEQPCLADPALGIVACGDWCLGGRVEGAYLSASAAAKQIIGWINHSV